MPKTISVRIDGELLSVPEGQTILEAARAHGREIPTLCYLKGLSAAGACRVCMVELAATDRLVPACTTPLQEGMSINTNSVKLANYRKMAVELLLVERNHVCAVCVSEGHCELQSLAGKLGIDHVRYSYNHPRLPVDMSHERFVLDHNRCILCTRCVRVCAEVEGAQVWEVASRGIHSRWSATCATTGAMRRIAPAAASAYRPALPGRWRKRASPLTRWSSRARPSPAWCCKEANSHERTVRMGSPAGSGRTMRQSNSRAPVPS